MDVVLDYQPGRVIPQITMQFECQEEEKPTENFVTVKLKGVHEPASFHLMCPHNTGLSIFPLFMLTLTNIYVIWYNYSLLHHHPLSMIFTYALIFHRLVMVSTAIRSVPLPNPTPAAGI